MTSMRSITRLLTAALVVATSVSCGNVVRDSRASVLIVVDSLLAAPGNKPSQLGSTLLSDVITNVTAPPPCAPATPCPTIFDDIGSVTMHTVPKDIGTPATPTTPSSNSDITITQYHVEYIRADGLNRPGVDVPFGFDGAVTGTVTSKGTTIAFEIVRHVAKEESPLVQLKISPDIIYTIAKVTFYGKDQVGNAVSVQAQISIAFGNFGDS